tara:strand:+ start:306 stop:437 length:132 start_codon:yes stop_codon:yes gene_type:complete
VDIYFFEENIKMKGKHFMLSVRAKSTASEFISIQIELDTFINY